MKTWNIDTTHSEIAFKAKHLMISTIRGVFNKFEGKIIANNDTFNDGHITFSVEVNSLETRNPDRNGHLLNPDFFYVEKFPTLSFSSTSIKRVADKLEITGDLTIKGVTKQIEVEAIVKGTNKGMEGEKVTAFDITAKINRQDFGLVWNVTLETGGVLIGEIVQIEAFIEVKEA